MRRIFSIILLAPLIFLLNCTDPIDLKINSGTPQLAIDGTITDQTLCFRKTLPDTVRLTITNGYTKGPSEVVSKAIVTIFDNFGNGDTLSYLNNGKYITDTSKIKGYVGRQYILTVSYEGETYAGIDVIPRTTKIDSLVSVYRPLPQFGRAPGYFVELYANDVKGKGDFYRLKVYKNNILYNRPSDLTLAADASFGTEGLLDSVKFIFPIREAMNPNTTETDIESGGNKAPFVPGENVSVEICSLSPQAYYFYSQVFSTISNDGLFATPSFNVASNMVNINPKSDKKAVGWFLTSAVSSYTIKIKPKQ